MEIHGLPPEIPKPDLASHTASTSPGPPLALPIEAQDPLEKASLEETRALRQEIAKRAPSGSPLEAVCKKMADIPAEAASAAVSSNNLKYITG